MTVEPPTGQDGVAGSRPLATSTLGSATQRAPSDRGVHHWRRDGVQLVALISVAAASVLVVLVQLGPALIGLKTFSGVDVLASYAPWNDRWLIEPWQNPFVGDTVDSLLPGYIETYRRLWSGDLPWWSTLAGSGSALLSAPNFPTLTPSGVWLLLAPTWWAIGFAKLVQLAFAFGGMMLWLRRLGTTWAAGALAGLLYCSSGFFVAWSGWLAQASVAATIPMLFWSIERFLALRTARSALVISAAVAWLLLGGFPAVAGHALYAGAIYFLVRCVVQRRTLGARGFTTTVLGGGAAVALGIGLSAVQLLPLVSTLAQTDTAYRASQFDGEQPFRSMLTVFFPRIFNPQGAIPHGFGPTSNPIEAYAYLGMGVVGLALLALLAGRWHRIARGVVPVLAVIGLLAAALVWEHGFWTDWLRDVPVFADNNSGRLRAMVAVAGCALAGIGFNLLFTRDLPRHVQIRLVVGAWVIVAGATAATVVAGIRYTPVVSDRLFLVDAALGLGSLGLVAVAFTLAHGRPIPPIVATDSVVPLDSVVPAGPAIALDSISPASEGDTTERARPNSPRRKLLALTLVVFASVTGAQAYLSTEFFWPLSDVADFYPETAGVAATRELVGADRVLAGDGTFLGSSGAANDIRTVTGHSFQAPTWREYLLAIDPNAFTPPGRTPTNPRVGFKVDNGSLDNPLLDRMAVTTVVTRPDHPVPGPVLDLQGNPRKIAPAPGSAPITVGEQAVSGGSLAQQNLRGFVVQVTDPAGDGIHGIGITVSLRDAAGQEIATGTSIRTKWDPGWTQIPVAAEDAAESDGPLTVWVSVRARDVPGQTLQLGGVNGQVDTLVIGSQPDGLREAYADGSVTIWQRLAAQPRIRWASDSLVIDDGAARLATLADPATPDSTVVLSAPGPEGGGGKAELTVLEDSGDRVAVDVQATDPGYLVLADAIQSGWAATVNGAPAELVDADHAFGAVYVGAGSSNVEFRFVGEGLRTGALVTGISLIIVVLVLVAPPVVRRIRRRGVAAAGARTPGGLPGDSDPEASTT